MISTLRLQNFRSYDDVSFAFGDGVNIIAGPNASGKTNLLEAVLMIARGDSYRARDAELLRFNQPWARIDAQTTTHNRVFKLKTAEPSRPPAKSFEIDGQTLTRLHISRLLPAVVFEPNHLMLLAGSPDMRRSFLDDLIEQIEVGYGATRRHYKRVLAQRNALLKQQPRDLAEQLFVWNLRLSELGGKIARARLALVDGFNMRASELYGDLAGRTTDVSLRYGSRFQAEAYESQLLHKLESNVRLEVERGFTAYGPHRDDLLAFIDGRAVQDAASRGETRTLVLVLKMLELHLLETGRGEKPLLLLDDVFSELDARRREALTAHVQTHQTFITTTDADVVAHHFAASNIIPLG